MAAFRSGSPGGNAAFSFKIARSTADNMPVNSGNVSGLQSYCRMLENKACAKLCR